MENKLGKKLVLNPINASLSKLGGTWKMPILWYLKDRKMRYGELKDCLPKISDKVFSAQLNDLQKNGFINKESFKTMPPKTIYSITTKGQKAIPVIVTLKEFGMYLIKHEQVKLN